MVDVCFYSDYGNNRCSIKLYYEYLNDEDYKTIEPILDKLFYKLILNSKSIISNNGFLYYHHRNIKNEYEKMKKELNNFFETKNYSRSSFIIDSLKQINHQSLITLFKNIWEAYEQPLFLFSSDKINENLKFLFEKNYSLNFKDLEKYNCYILYKCSENDVIWIHKSQSLSFDDIIPEEINNENRNYL